MYSVPETAGAEVGAGAGVGGVYIDGKLLGGVPMLYIITIYFSHHT